MCIRDSHLEQKGFVKGYEAALKDKDKDIVSDKDKDIVSDKSKVGKGKCIVLDKSEGKGSDMTKGSGKNDKGKKSATTWYSIATPEVGSVTGMDKNLFFLIVGIPGSGKSTCLAKAMDNYPNMEYVKEPIKHVKFQYMGCLLYTSPSPRDKRQSRMPSSA